MIKLGLLWLQGGAWKDEQLIPADWLEAASTQVVKSDRYEDYGYGLWVGPESEPIPYFFASGRGGQRILVAPALDLVIATTGGGFDPGGIVDPAMATLADPANPLPPNPGGEARLRDAVAAVAAPPTPEPVHPLPATAAEIGGRTFALSPNAYGLQAIEVAFPSVAEAMLTLSDQGSAIPRPVGLDGVYRWSQGPNGVLYGISARWSDASTLVFDYNTIGDIRAYTITAHYVGDTLEITVAQRDERMVTQLTGRAQ
jgi:hypothetical protein